MKASLATRIRLLVAAICLGFGLAVLIAFNFLAGRHLQSRAKEDVSTVTSSISRSIGEQETSLRTLVHFVSNSPRIFNLALTDAQTVADAAPQLRKDLGYDFILTRRDGSLLGATGYKPSDNLDPKLTPPVSRALSGQEWSGVFEQNGDLILAVSEPLIQGRGAEQAEVGTFTAYERLGRGFAARIRGGAPIDIAFVHRGVVTSGTVEAAGLKVQDLKSPWSVSLGSTEYVASYAALPLTAEVEGLGFIILRPKSDVFEAYRQFSFAFLYALLAVSAIALIGGTIFSSGIARSLDQVVQAAKLVRAGEWPERIEITRKDEIGILESAFNDMADSIRQSQERLLSMIDVDPLTELDNHRRFKERLNEESARTAEQKQPLSLLLLDVDDFGEFNENFGHTAGDLKLKAIAAAIRFNKPEFGTAARYEGEKFAILMPNATVKDAKALYEKIRKGVRAVTLSGGCADLACAKGNADGMIVACELALTRAKQLGKNRVADFGSVPGSEEAEPLHLYANLKEGTYATVKALAAAVDAKDPYTHGHSDRVAKFASELASYVGASATEIDLIHRCGTLHDVGKIGVPDAILSKPGRLEPEEFRSMQTHPVLGEFIVSKVPQLRELLPGVRHHHERYDGKGYPDGLSGQNIPLIARFLAIADTYDAMTSDRPYRAGLDQEVALCEIEKGAGTQFDPELAPAFAAMMRELHAVGRPRRRSDLSASSS